MTFDKLEAGKTAVTFDNLEAGKTAVTFDNLPDLALEVCEHRRG
ncbi:MAG: hypothetical protein OXN44_00465 [Acidimicrobiaceae bacterium]|nr:hypothetical protein [Acidimicrobiaceae bacterium]